MADTFTPRLNLIKPDVLKDALIGDINGNMDLIDSEFVAVDTRLDALDTDVPVDLGGSVTTAANWGSAFWRLYKVGRVCQLYLNVTRLNSALTNNSEGNLGNTHIGTVPAGTIPIADVPVNGGMGFGYQWTGMIQTDGKLYITSANPNQTIAINDVLTGGATWIAGS